MSPRKYSMDKRRASVEETRRRIVEATLALHTEKGMFDTSWRDIAERADLSVATVYKHFPTMNELAPACGALVMSLIDPPSLNDVPRIFEGVRTLEERLEGLVSELFGFYERGEPYLEVTPKERELQAVREWEAGMRAVREGLAREALRPVRPDEGMVRALGALLDFPVYKSFRRVGVTRAEAEEMVREMVHCWIRGRRVGGEG